MPEYLVNYNENGAEDEIINSIQEIPQDETIPVEGYIDHTALERCEVTLGTVTPRGVCGSVFGSSLHAIAAYALGFKMRKPDYARQLIKPLKLSQNIFLATVNKIIESLHPQRSFYPEALIVSRKNNTFVTRIADVALSSTPPITTVFNKIWETIDAHYEPGIPILWRTENTTKCVFTNGLWWKVPPETEMPDQIKTHMEYGVYIRLINEMQQHNFNENILISTFGWYTYQGGEQTELSPITKLWQDDVVVIANQGAEDNKITDPMSINNAIQMACTITSNNQSRAIYIGNRAVFVYSPELILIEWTLKSAVSMLPRAAARNTYTFMPTPENLKISSLNNTDEKLKQYNALDENVKTILVVFLYNRNSVSAIITSNHNVKLNTP